MRRSGGKIIAFGGPAGKSREAALEALLGMCAKEGRRAVAVGEPLLSSGYFQGERARVVPTLLRRLLAYRTTFRRERRRAAHGGVVAVDGGWFDLVLRPEAYDLPPSASDTARRLARLAPAADLAVIVPGSPGAAWVESWGWPLLAPWAGRKVVRLDTLDTADLQKALSALRGDDPRPLRWGSVPFSAGRDVRATVGRGVGVALDAVWPRGRGRILAALNAPLLRRGITAPTFPPAAELEQLCERIGVKPEAMAATRDRTRERYIVAVIHGGRLGAVLKLGQESHPALAREDDVLRRLASAPRSFAVPKVLWSGPWNGRFIVAMRPVRFGRVRTTRRAEDLVDLCIELQRSLGDLGPVVHGDLAPWNVLDTPEGLAVIDWEEARFEQDPLYDLAHFVTQQGAVLRRLAPRRAVATLIAAGSPGWRYLESLGLDPVDAPKLVAGYLERSMPGADARARRFRLSMLRVLGEDQGIEIRDS